MQSFPMWCLHDGRVIRSMKWWKSHYLLITELFFNNVSQQNQFIILLWGQYFHFKFKSLHLRCRLHAKVYTLLDKTISTNNNLLLFIRYMIPSDFLKNILISRNSYFLTKKCFPQHVFHYHDSLIYTLHKCLLSTL